MRRRPGRPRTRRELGLPPEVPLALVTGGALGIGQLEQAACDVAATGLAHPVVLCGRNAALRLRLDGVAGVTRLGWRDDLPAVLEAMDVVVQNAGGFTSQQAIAAGVPLLSYRCLPGHGETNAAALEQAGLAHWVREPERLRGGPRPGAGPAPADEPERRAGGPTSSTCCCRTGPGCRHEPGRPASPGWRRAASSARR